MSVLLEPPDRGGNLLHPPGGTTSLAVGAATIAAGVAMVILQARLRLAETVISGGCDDLPLACGEVGAR